MDTRKILFARYRLNHEALREFNIYVLDFPYWDVIDEFLSVIAKNPLREKEKYLFNYDEDLPFLRLNPVLVGSFPFVIQGFETYGNSKDKFFLPGLRRKVVPRRMIALELHDDDAVSQNPVVGDLAFIIQEWLEEWVTTNFENGRFSNELELFGGAGQKAFEVMLDKIGKIKPKWEFTNAAELWERQNAKDTQALYRLAYNALPSILAAQFVEATKGQAFELLGKENTYMLREWWLTQNGGSNNKHLAVVSEPIPWRNSNGNKEGKFSYMLQFIVQTQAGSHNPWVAVYISIRRWMTKPLKSTNFKRDVSIYLRLAASWTEDGQYSNTLIQLKLTGNYSKTKEKTYNSLKWDYNPSSLIENLKGGKGRGLIDPTSLVENPRGYHNPTKDQYYGLHAEGMDYVGAGIGHPVQTGTALALRGQVMLIISEHLEAYLAPDTALVVDDKGILSIEAMHQQRLTALYNHIDLTTVGTLHPKGSRKAKSERKSLTLNALNQARDGKAIQILLAFYSDETHQWMKRYVLKILCADEHELPNWLTIEAVPLQASLLERIPLPKTEEGRKKQKTQLKRTWRDKVARWEDKLSQYVDQNTHTLIFVEMLGSMARATEEDDWLKSAIRQVCVCVGASSQMLYNIRIDGMPIHYKMSEYSRIRNATYDLLLRQTALRYGEPSQIYELAGMTREEAQKLIVVGLYRHVTNFPTSIDYPVAVMSYPDGRTDVILPDEDGNICEPVPYLRAGIEIGRTFTSAKKKRAYNFYNETQQGNNGYRLKRFAEQVLSEVNKWGQPCLVLMEAEWRKWGLLPVGNGVIQQNAIAINNQIMTAMSLSNLRLLRIRDAGTLNETPQYVELRDGDNWFDVENPDDPTVMTGIVDTHADSPFTHYFSIGRQPDTFKHDNEQLTFESSGNNAHKHQQAIEFVPFFLQSDDDELVYCRIAHFLRSSPAWRSGNTVLPYPLHLAKTLITDQLDVFEPTI